MMNSFYAHDNRALRRWTGSRWEPYMVHSLGGDLLALDGTGEVPEWIAGFDGSTAVIFRRAP